MTAADDSGLKVRRRFDPPNYTFPSGCHICEVEIDPVTGQVTVVDYLLVQDVGVAINPKIVAGQLEGGVGKVWARRCAKRSSTIPRASC